MNNLLQNLDDPSNAYNAQHVYILNSLTDTKSIVLVTDLERSDELITPLFRICFDIVSGAIHNASGQELAKSVEFQLRSMLVTIIDEASLPQEAIDVILSQFLRVDPRTQQAPSTKSKKQDTKDKKQDTLHLKDYPPAYNMAKSICTTCTDKMTTYVTQYVGTIIMNASAALSEEAPSKHHVRKVSEVEDDDEDDESLADLRKAHRLVRELWRACPDVLINVIPQIEAELQADATSLRQLATETLGDIIAGIGISGIPPTASLDPTVYPLPSVDEPAPGPLSTNPLLVPASPKPFSSVHSSTYTAFLGRKIDKSPLIRNAWVVAISRILSTDAGGIGLGSEDRQTMLVGYSQMLKDIDEKVRHTAVQAISDFTYHTTINVIGADGGLAAHGSVLSTLADRVTDRKHSVREDAMTLLGQIWGTGSRDVQSGVESVVGVVGNIPSRLCNAMYVNDLHIHMQLDRVLYESLLPITFPPIKVGSKSESQKRGKANSRDNSNIDADHIRASRILTLIRSLDAKAKQVFFGIQKRQVDMSKAMKVFLKACEDYNGGVVDDDAEEKSLKEQLTKYIQAISKQYPDPTKASTDLWKFVKMHDRRNYQLIRFATGPEHDYRTMSKAIKELTKRIGEGTPTTQAIMDTLQPLLYRCALVVYNRSHVPAIMEISRSDEAGLAETAHEVLKEISARNPEVLKSHIQALCKELEDNAPTSTKSESTSAADTLKACAGFARKYPAEVPKDRKFLAAMSGFALFSLSPRAAKHAVTILLTVSDKKELHAKDLITKAVKDCNPESPHYLARLATVSQIYLLVPAAAKAEEDAILEIAVVDCLQRNRSPEKRTDLNAWEDTLSEEMIAKQLALKIIVNRCRSADDKNQSDFDTLANSVIAVLMRLIEKEGEMATNEDTPPAQRNLLRLTAAHYILKLCSHKRRCEELVTPQMFISIALIVINPPNAARSKFVEHLQKYLGRTNLHPRWYTIFYLIAFEPDVELKSKTVNWLKSRVSFFDRQQRQASTNQPGKTTVMENIFARLLSLLAHHPDYPDAQTSDFEPELLDFARYIVFYLQCVATEDNISLIFHVAQRVKQTRDGITGTEEASERLYVLSDLAQAVIRNFADLLPSHAKGINSLQTWPGRVAMPTSLFSALPSSTVAQEIAAKNYLPEDVALGLERLVRNMVRGGKSRDKNKSASTADRKRKGDSVDLDDSDVEKKSKKIRRSSILPIRKTPKSNSKRKGRENEGDMSIEQPSRKSARTSNVKSYAESDEDDDGPVASSPITTKSSLKTSGRSTDKRNDSVPEPETTVTEDEALVELEKAVSDEDIEMEEQPSSGNDDDEQETAETPANGVSDNEEADEDQADANEDEDEDGDGETEGTPSPVSRRNRSAAATRATRADAPQASTKKNVKEKSQETIKARGRAQGKAEPRPKANGNSTTKSTSRAKQKGSMEIENVSSTATPIREAGKGKGVRAATGKGNSKETPTASAGTRRSTRSTKG